MKPVVVNPATTFEQLANEVRLIDSDERAQMQLDQIIAKIQRKKRKMTAEYEQRFTYNAGGQSPDTLIQSLRQQPIGESLSRVA